MIKNIFDIFLVIINLIIFFTSIFIYIFIKNLNMKITFDNTVNVLYSDKNIYINQDKFEYNSKLNKQIKIDFYYFLLCVVHRKKNNFSKKELTELLKKEKYINYNIFSKLLFYIKNKLFMGDYGFSFNSYSISSKKRNLYRKWLLYIVKYELEACIRIQSVIRGYLIRKI